MNYEQFETKKTTSWWSLNSVSCALSARSDATRKSALWIVRLKSCNILCQMIIIPPAKPIQLHETKSWIVCKACIGVVHLIFHDDEEHLWGKNVSCVLTAEKIIFPQSTPSWHWEWDLARRRRGKQVEALRIDESSNYFLTRFPLWLWQISSRVLHRDVQALTRTNRWSTSTSPVG